MVYTTRAVLAGVLSDPASLLKKGSGKGEMGRESQHTFTIKV